MSEAKSEIRPIELNIEFKTNCPVTGSVLSEEGWPSVGSVLGFEHELATTYNNGLRHNTLTIRWTEVVPLPEPSPDVKGEDADNE